MGLISYFPSAARISLIAVFAALLATFSAPAALGEDASGADAAVEKANLYIEVARSTERAAESWERYASWVNMKTGPTGKERYISYGMYNVPEMTGAFIEARKGPGMKPATPALDTLMERYMQSFEAVAPLLSRAAAYYEAEEYRADNMAQGKAMHVQMVPLMKTYLTERDAMLSELRVFVREAEALEVAEVKAREGEKSRNWQVANVMHASNRVIDVFPRVRPTPMDAETMEAEMMAIGPDTPGEKFEQIMAGVVPPVGIVIDMTKFDPAMKAYAEAVEIFERFAKEQPEELEDFKDGPRKLLVALQALQEPLAKNEGRDFEGSGQLAGRVVQIYFDMQNEGNSIQGSRLRYLP